MARYREYKLEDLPDGRYWLLSVVDDSDRLILRLEDDPGQAVTIVFDEHLAYMRRDESDAYGIVVELSKTIPSNASLCIAEESRLLDLFVAESGGLRDGTGLTHYILVAMDDVMDIIALGEPSILP